MPIPGDLYHGEYPVDMTPREARAELARMSQDAGDAPDEITRLKARIAELEAAAEKRVEKETLPCPFCGGKAVIREYDERYPTDAFGLIVDHAPGCFLDMQRSFDMTFKAWEQRTDTTRKGDGA